MAQFSVAHPNHKLGHHSPSRSFLSLLHQHLTRTHVSLTCIPSLSHTFGNIRGYQRRCAIAVSFSRKTDNVHLFLNSLPWNERRQRKNIMLAKKKKKKVKTQKNQLLTNENDTKITISNLLFTEGVGTYKTSWYFVNLKNNSKDEVYKLRRKPNSQLHVLRQEWYAKQLRVSE